VAQRRVMSMPSKQSWLAYGFSLLILVAVVGIILGVNRDVARTKRDAAAQTDASGVAAVTSRQGLERRIAQLERTLRERPTDSTAAVSLADALMRQARVTGNAGLALRAEQALKGVLRDEPADYDARRMLATVYLSEHRFRDAVVEADRMRTVRPTDDWNFGVLGDGHLELGEYDEAFSAFQRMMDLRPTAGAYARAAYALELQGDLEAALEAMRLSVEATPPTDPESIAWHHAQIGDLYRQMGNTKDAAYEYAWAEHTFPGHPFAVRGMAALLEAAGDRAGAASQYEAVMATTPSPDIAEKLGDLYTAMGRSADASREYALAEAGWRFDAPNPAMLARFLAEHDRALSDAVALAESAARERHDIFTQDALAWCYFKSGRVREAAAAIKQARRTGSKDQTILRHAVAISEAVSIWPTRQARAK
jgi:tetratricopeptide (TPR) repeat protein